LERLPHDDPAILGVGGTYYAYAITTGGASLPVMTSTDLETWTAHGDALGVGPSCSPRNGAGDTNQWSSSVARLPDGSYMAAFAARTGAGARRCIATAHASSPLGPFVSSGSGRARPAGREACTLDRSRSW
jgi:beta-xylosidase